MDTAMGAIAGPNRFEDTGNEEARRPEFGDREKLVGVGGQGGVDCRSRSRKLDAVLNKQPEIGDIGGEHRGKFLDLGGAAGVPDAAVGDDAWSAGNGPRSSEARAPRRVSSNGLCRRPLAARMATGSNDAASCTFAGGSGRDAMAAGEGGSRFAGVDPDVMSWPPMASKRRSRSRSPETAMPTPRAAGLVAKTSSTPSAPPARSASICPAASATSG